MNTIFISPLLWKKFSRAVKRREEGQALVLVAMAAVALVAVVGLSVDGGMTFLEAQQLQRAADAAALAGVVWVPSHMDIADSRGRLTVQSSGYNSFYQSGTKQASYTFDQVMGGTPGQYTAYWGDRPNNYRYKVTLGVKARRYFLGVLGFGDYYVQREATAEYAQQVKLGGSYNYFGNSALLYDPVIRDQASSTTNPTQQKDYYTTLWNRYYGATCYVQSYQTQPDPCQGTFWLTIQGPDTAHASGDAYTPLADGAAKAGSVSGAGTGNYPSECRRFNDWSDWQLPTAWYFSVGKTNTAACNERSGTLNNLNFDRHPDSIGNQGFGYSIAVQLDRNAFKPYTVTSINSQPPYKADGVTPDVTSFKVSIYDASMADVGDEKFGSGDNFWWENSSAYKYPPYRGANNSLASSGISTVVTSNKSISTRTDDQKLLCNELSSDKDINGNYGPSTSADGQSRYEAGRIVTGNKVTQDNRYCQNGMRTRFSLYYPPESEGTPTQWNTRNGLVAAFDATELTASNENWIVTDSIFGSNTITNATVCYFADPSIVGGVQTVGSIKTLTITKNLTSYSPDTVLLYACGTEGITNYNKNDFYWNAVPSTTSQTSYANRITNTNGISNVVYKGTNSPDPSQSCRSMLDPLLYVTDSITNVMNLSLSISPPYLGKKIPYNMRGMDPVWTGSQVQYVYDGDSSTGGYQSYHGWRCGWDFDSNNTLNPSKADSTGQLGSTYSNVPGITNTMRQQAEGITNQPYLFISDWGYVNGGTYQQRITYKDGIRKLANVDTDSPNVRNGVYLLQVQTFGGAGSNRYAVKAEYENPKLISATYTNPVNGSTVKKSIYPVPQVYGISSMAVYVNAINNSSSTPLDIIFDLAYIPKQNAGAYAILELFDAGDVGITNLDVQLLKPSGYGQKLVNGKVPTITNSLLTTNSITGEAKAIISCPMQFSGGAIACTMGSSITNTVNIKSGGTIRYNDQWLLIPFIVPDSTQFDTWGQSCYTNEVPEVLCYYFQINYRLQGSGKYASDTTTWQLDIRNQPVHLIT